MILCKTLPPTLQFFELGEVLYMTYTRKSCHFRSQKESDNEAQDKNRARV